MSDISKILANASPELQAAFAAMQARLDAAKADSQRKITLKVSEKGAVALYGLGRFQVTLYRGQWERVIEAAKSGQIERFIEANASLLSVKS